MGALARELSECAADAKVICMVGTATHVLYTGLNVRLRVDQFGAGAPGFCMQHLFTGVLLKAGKHEHNYPAARDFMQIHIFTSLLLKPTR